MPFTQVYLVGEISSNAKTILRMSRGEIYLEKNIFFI